MSTVARVTHFIVDCKVANLHRHGDEVDRTIQLILLKLLFKVYILLAESAKTYTLHHYDVIHMSHDITLLPMTNYCLRLSDEEHKAEEMDKELQHHCREGVEVEDIRQGTLFRESGQGLYKITHRI